MAARRREPSRISRSPSLAACAQGTGGFITLYGGKLTTHRALAEDTLFMLNTFGLEMSGPWTKDVPLYGGSLNRETLLAHAEEGPEEIPLATRRRWALTYGDKIEDLFARIGADAGRCYGDCARRTSRRTRPCRRDRGRHDG